jgi:hypothetical protein
MQIAATGIQSLLGSRETMILFDSTPIEEPDDPWSNGQQVNPMFQGQRITPPARQWAIFRELSSGKVQGSNIQFPINANAMLVQIPQAVLAYRGQVCP